MTENQTDDQPQDPPDSDGPRDSKSKTGRMGDGIRQGIGVLSALRDALEETIQEARDRGDLSAERAKDVMKEALGKAQDAAEGAKVRLDFATQADLDSLRAGVDSVKARLADLERSVFGASKPEDDSAEAPRGSGQGRAGGKKPSSEEAPSGE